VRCLVALLFTRTADDLVTVVDFPQYPLSRYSVVRQPERRPPHPLTLPAPVVEYHIRVVMPLPAIYTLVAVQEVVQELN
jgi:hypothetical protein